MSWKLFLYICLMVNNYTMPEHDDINYTHSLFPRID